MSRSESRVSDRREAPASDVDFWRPPVSDRRSLPIASRAPRLFRLLRERRSTVEARTRLLMDAGVLIGIGALLLVFFKPSLLFSATTATGGDVGAHIYAPLYLREHLLPNGLIAGWSPGWFAGFPMLTFYFPLIAVGQALLSYVIPMEVAFKLGMVVGTFFLPAAFYIMFRLLRFPFPAPVVAAAMSVGFLFMHSFTIYGGNILGSFAGEYSYSLSLGLCLVLYGCLYRVVHDDGPRLVLSVVVLTLAVLSHLLPVIVVVLMAPLYVWWGVRRLGWAPTARRLLVIFGLAFGLTAFWSVPFLARIGYTANMNWIPVEGWGPLAPRELWIYLAPALAGAITGAVRSDGRVLVLAGPGLAGALIYLFLPQGHAWNGRFLPFWYLAVFACAAYFVGSVLPSIVQAVTRRWSSVAAAGLAAVVFLASSGWILWDRKSNPVGNWIIHNLEGYEAKPGWSDFRALMDELSDLPPGRVMWEPSPDQGQYGTPIALMSIPYWTDHTSMEGIYFESSVTTPFHFLAVSQLAVRPSNPIAGLPYGKLDLPAAVEHMKLFGVSYFLSFSPEVARAARQTPGLEPMATVGPFQIFRVVDAAQVVVSPHVPVVLEDADWVDTNARWLMTPEVLDVPLVRDGPDEWPRATSEIALPRDPVPGGGAPIEATVTEDSIEFDTADVGKPHWVRTSFFPNWKAEGAEGPYLASPSLMMVVPTQRHVELSYRRTWAEWSGLLLTFAALGALVIAPARRRLLDLALRRGT